MKAMIIILIELCALLFITGSILYAAFEVLSLLYFML
jgi:hypothetical protein